MLKIFRIDELSEIKLGINQQVMWLFVEAAKIVFNQFVHCFVEFLLVHTFNVCIKLPYRKSMPAAGIIFRWYCTCLMGIRHPRRGNIFRNFRQVSYIQTNGNK